MVNKIYKMAIDNIFPLQQISSAGLKTSDPQHFPGDECTVP
jgi:hypothetical protein